MGRGFRYLEAFVIALLVVIGLRLRGRRLRWRRCWWPRRWEGFVLTSEVAATNPAMLHPRHCILGATVMPHNPLPGSPSCRPGRMSARQQGKREAIRWATTDRTVALTLALLVNAAISYPRGLGVPRQRAHRGGGDRGGACAAEPDAGAGHRVRAVRVALRPRGLSSTVTATLAGQIVMEGFLRLRLPDWARRLVTRAIAIVPVLVVTAAYGESGMVELLVFSQVVLSMQPPFAVIPLGALRLRSAPHGQLRYFARHRGGGLGGGGADRGAERQAAVRHVAS